MNKNVDLLIVGAGLAGVWTAFRARERNKTFALYDQAQNNHSSRVAAGIYNPLLARRQKLSFNVQKLYPDLGKKYHALEQALGLKFLHRERAAYLIEDLRELNDWAALIESEHFSNYVMLRNERISDHILSDFGYLDILGSGWVDLPLLLDGFAASIRSPEIFRSEEFDAGALQISDEGFIYHDIFARDIIFCQGCGISSNPLTRHILLKPAKGEVLQIWADDLIEGLIPQNGVFMLPQKQHTFRVGSNFTWEDLSTETTEAARDEIVRKFCRWYKGPFSILGQVAGIRPSSLDRRPMLGRLDFHPAAWILNGFGSKGVAYAPYYSDMLLKCIYDGIPVDKDVDVKRFL